MHRTRRAAILAILCLAVAIFGNLQVLGVWGRGGSRSTQPRVVESPPSRDSAAPARSNPRAKDPLAIAAPQPAERPSQVTVDGGDHGDCGSISGRVLWPDGTQEANGGAVVVLFVPAYLRRSHFRDLDTYPDRRSIAHDEFSPRSLPGAWPLAEVTTGADGAFTVPCPCVGSGFVLAAFDEERSLYGTAPATGCHRS